MYRYVYFSKVELEEIKYVLLVILISTLPKRTLYLIQYVITNFVKILNCTYYSFFPFQNCLHSRMDTHVKKMHL